MGRGNWLANWIERHQHPFSRGLHYVGIPLTVAAVGLAGWQLAGGQSNLWPRPVGLFAPGYVLQWVGHLIEGNDTGEIIVIKKLLQKPYTAVAPRYQSRSGSADSEA